MSNAAVVKLQRKKIGKYSVWLDDNFAESIHLHINDARVDMTCEEFSALCAEIKEALNEYITVENFDIDNYDATFLSGNVNRKLSCLYKISFDKVLLSQLICGREKKTGIVDGECYRFYKGETVDNKKSTTDHINQTRIERNDAVLLQVKEYGYPYDNKYILLNGDTNSILDGMHRASALMFLNGDMEIPVLRLYFKEGLYTVTTRDKAIYYLRRIYGILRGLKPKKKNSEKLDEYIAQTFNNR